MTISLVVPVFNEEEIVQQLWQRLTEAVRPFQDYRFEVVFVDDGSSDKSVSLIEQLLVSEHIWIKVVQFSRNFGQQAAISAGMEHAAGEAIIFLDADLQDPPELIGTFLQKYREGYDVVYAIRQNLKESWWRVMMFQAFYRGFNLLAEQPMPLDAGDFSLISRRVAKLIVAMPERDRLVRGLRSWVGFKQIGVPYDRPERAAGESRYGFRKHVQLALDGLFSFSRAPIRLSLYTGLAVCAIAGAYLAKSYVAAIFFGAEAPKGWTSLITLAFMAAGANIIATSIVGEYVCRLYFQTKQRPLYVVETVKLRQPSAP